MNKLIQIPLIKQLYLQAEKITHLIPDKTYLKIIYRIRMGKKLNIDNPYTYNEKIQWLKLNDRKPIYTKMVDKCEAKKYVAAIIGEEYIIPTLGVWNHFDEIDFDMLPNQFVLKCTHDSGGLVIVRDKKRFDKNTAKRKIEKALKRNFYWKGREWPYKDIKPRIIAEKYILFNDEKTENTETDLKDYKFFSFNGTVKALFVASERNSEEETKFDFFDANYNHLPFTNGHPNAEIIPAKPNGYDKMIELAEKLSQDIPHVRVDFYEINNKIYFGELTFSHWSGLVPFVPEQWDIVFGEWIELPSPK